MNQSFVSFSVLVRTKGAEGSAVASQQGVLVLVLIPGLGRLRVFSLHILKCVCEGGFAVLWFGGWSVIGWKCEIAPGVKVCVNVFKCLPCPECFSAFNPIITTGIDSRTPRGPGEGYVVQIMKG